ncbi:S8 family serine peptidase [uncultured Flavobacterium sp.]|uniref:S8 family serine peptidase n=1 Tax=uncultured Flavobacterium sp. TaxID=165435 RepID=UPI0025F9C713|nr:S8 family serine peptidase [uncultured Flavobacterium sp.]
MKKLYIIFVLLVHTGFYAQQEDAWIYFTDKPNAAFYLDNPLEMLTQKALDRRTAQGIALDIADVPVHQPYINGISATSGIAVMAKSKWLNCVHVRGSEDAINSLSAFSFVYRVDFANKLLNTSGRPSGVQQPGMVNKTMETAADFSYGNAASQVQMLNGHLLHQQGFTGSGMTIAVMDNGFPGVNTTQPFQRLYDNSLILGGYNFVEGSTDVYTGGIHGTLVLSTMGGYTEGQLVGTAPDAFYYLFVTEDTAGENPVEESYWVEAAEMADRLGADIINTSLGYFLYDNPNYSYTYEDMNGETAFITRGANMAFTRGLLCVTSAGNSAATANPNIGVPADAFNTLTVGAVTSEEQYASFSSIGPTADGRVKPDVMAQGFASAIANPQGEITSANGTSFSSPITAGLAACLWQALPEFTNGELLQLIKQSADRFGSPGPQYGYGIPDFAMALSTGLGNKDSILDKFVIFPNPSATILNIYFTEAVHKVKVTVHNSVGQCVLLVDVYKSQPTFDISKLASGIYSYTIEGGQETQSGKLIKQ